MLSLLLHRVSFLFSGASEEATTAVSFLASWAAAGRFIILGQLSAAVVEAILTASICAGAQGSFRGIGYVVRP